MTRGPPFVLFRKTQSKVAVSSSTPSQHPLPGGVRDGSWAYGAAPETAATAPTTTHQLSLDQPWPLLTNRSPRATAFCFGHPNNLKIHLGTKIFKKNTAWAVAPLAGTQRWCWLILQTGLLRASPAQLTGAWGLRLPKNAYRASKQRSAAARAAFPPLTPPRTA